MGFTSFEKKSMTATLRDGEQINAIFEKDYPDDILEFLRQQNLLGQVRDYAIISNKQKLNKPEHLTMTYVLDPDTFVYDILSKWQEFLSPPVILTQKYK